MYGILKKIDTVSEWSGKVLSVFLLIITALFIYEVTLRYFFDAPTIWVNQTNAQLFGAYAVLSGAYVFLHKSHVKIDLFYSLLSPRKQAILDAFTYLIFFFSVIILLWYSSKTALHSIIIGEIAPFGLFRPPLYPIRLTIPVAALLLLLQGLRNWIQVLSMAIKGRELT
jgi:TRAP-type mannitol/chloroaromatic compound transport system permease small subunit